jgi:hypothetical protein
MRQLLDERGSKILTKGVADLAPLCFCGVVSIEGEAAGFRTETLPTRLSGSGRL